MEMKKILAVLLLLLFSTQALPSCQKNSQFTHQLSICGSYGVPGMFCSDLKGMGSDCNMMETDSQGRILFSYTAQNIMTKKQESVLVICQRYDEKYVYFYEDLCYLREPYESSDVDEWKQHNDWDASVDYSKMSRRKNKVSFDLVIVSESALKYQELRPACRKALNISESQIKELCFVDEDLNGHELYWLELDIDGETEAYFIIADLNYNIATMAVHSGDLNVLDLSQFKQQNGWVYGFTD